VTSALGIRSEVNPLGPEIEKLVAEALAALEQMEAEAIAGGDPMASYFAMQALVLRANRALLNGTTAAAAQSHHPVTDAQWRAGGAWRSAAHARTDRRTADRPCCRGIAVSVLVHSGGGLCHVAGDRHRGWSFCVACPMH
jgi:hypothetical protein